MSDEAESSSQPVVFRRVNKKRPLTVRKREDKSEKAKEENSAESNGEDQSDNEKLSSSSNSDDAVQLPVKKGVFASRNRRLQKNPLLINSKRRGRPKEEASNSSSSSQESDDEEAERQRALDIDVTIKSSGTGTSDVPKDMGATRVSEHDTAHDRDYQAQFERVQKQLKDDQQPGSSKEKVYRGLKMYGAKEAKDTTKGKASSGLNHYGPIRGQQFMRASVRWDYAPDVCKDYKETGFCTFGDSCKFMHDRSDYKHGWEIEAEWQRQQAAKNKPEEDYTIYSDED